MSSLPAPASLRKKGFFVVVNVVKNKGCSVKTVKTFEERLRDILRGMSCAINSVDAIPASPKGKRSFIVNEDRELLERYLARQLFHGAGTAGG